MFHFALASVLACCGMICSVCSACDCGPGDCQPCVCGCPCGAAAKTASAPTVTQAKVSQGYRTYSYQPAAGPVLTTPARTYGTRAAMNGFHDAGWKIRGGN
jgi:hypothetical protein